MKTIDEVINYLESEINYYDEEILKCYERKSEVESSEMKNVCEELASIYIRKKIELRKVLYFIKH